MNLSLSKLTTSVHSRRRGRRHLIGGSDSSIITGPDEAPFIRLLKEERGEAEPRIHRANVRLRIPATSAQHTTRVSCPRPGNSVVCWFFKLFLCSCPRAQPNADPGSVFTDKDQSRTPRRGHQFFDRAQPRASTCLKSINGVHSKLSASASSAVLQSKAARTAPHLIGITGQSYH
jgi:hypothetical protein